MWAVSVNSLLEVLTKGGENGQPLLRLMLENLWLFIQIRSQKLQKYTMKHLAMKVNEGSEDKNTV